MTGGTVKVTSHRRIITPACRRAKGDVVALEEALESAAGNARDLLEAWPVDSGARVHVTVEVEYPRGAAGPGPGRDLGADLAGMSR